MNKNKLYYLIIVISMITFSFSAIHYEAYLWLVGTFFIFNIFGSGAPSGRDRLLKIILQNQCPFQSIKK